MSSSTQVQTTTAPTSAASTDAGSISLRGREPLKQTGALDQYASFEVTPVIGREYPDLSLTALLTAPNSDDLIRELAVIISERGVAFFRAQDIDVAQQKELGLRLGRLSGNPKESGLHVHPITEEGSELGDEISVIDSARNQVSRAHRSHRSAAEGWHSGKSEPGSRNSMVERVSGSPCFHHPDVTFELVPSDFAILKVHTLPPTGGDTLWASA